jgi:putative transposase
LVGKGWSQRRACALVGLACGSYYPVAQRRNDEPVQQALRALSGRHPGWVFWKLHHHLRKNGLVINHKRTLRIYRALALNLLRRLKKRVLARVKQPLAVPTMADLCWALDFTSDVLTDGRRFRALNVLDDYNRQLLGVEIDFSLPDSRVVQVLTRLVDYHGSLAQLRKDNGPEFNSARLSEWCKQLDIVLHWIQPGKPTQNAYIERFNGSFRRELLDAHLFRSLTHVRQLVDEWMHDYNTQRPHQTLNLMTPLEFKQAA